MNTVVFAAGCRECGHFVAAVTPDMLRHHPQIAGDWLLRGLFVSGRPWPTEVTGHAEKCSHWQEVVDPLLRKLRAAMQEENVAQIDAAAAADDTVDLGQLRRDAGVVDDESPTLPSQEEAAAAVLKEIAKDRDAQS